MPTFRIVYIDDDTVASRTLTAAFADRAAAEIAMAKHGHRVVHAVQIGAGEQAKDPIRIPVSEEGQDRVADAAMPRPERAPAARTLFGPPRYDLAGVAVAVVAVAGAAFLLF